MAKHTTNPPGAGGARRKPVVIDLPAENVSRQTAAGPGGEQPAELIATEAPQAEKTDPAVGTSAVPAPDAVETGRTAEIDPAVAMGTEQHGEAAAAAAATDVSQETPFDRAEPERPPVSGSYPPPPPLSAPPEKRRGAGFPGLFAAALLGGIASAAAVLALDSAGILPFASDSASQADVASLRAELDALRPVVADLRQAQATAAPPPDIVPLQTQVAALEQAVTEFRERPAAASDSAGLTEVQTRLSELERLASEANATQPNTAQPNAALEGRLTELASEIETLRAAAPGEAAEPALTAVAARIDEVAGRLGSLEERPPVDLSGLETDLAEVRQHTETLAAGQQALPELASRLAELANRIEALPSAERVAALETSLNATSEQVEQAEALGPAVAANALTEALQSGAPFRAELDALRGLGLDEPTLAGLEPHADQGLPTLADLRSSFEAAIADISLATPVPAGAGAMERLLQSARGLVEVRPARPTEGTDPGAILARMRGALKSSDLSAALTEWNALPEPAKAALTEWADQAEARQAADQLAARLRTEALARLATQG